MGRVFRYVLQVLVLATVFLVSALTSMRFAIHGHETSVPKLIGMTPAEAERATVANGLLLEVENRFYSAEVAEGRILSQVPAPGAQVRRGWKVRVAQSLGPQRVTIPNVVGESEHAAEINLVQRGLQVGTVATIHLPGLPAEQIIGQSPSANAAGIASPKVDLLLTAPAEKKSPMYVMPDFVGQRFGEATAAIVVAGCKLGGATVTLRPGSPLANDGPRRLKPIATDTIVSQSPPPGQKIPAGASISFALVR